MENIKKLRELIGVKQPELATLLNLHTSNYSAIEKGYIRPKNLDEIKVNCYAFLEKLNQQRHEQIKELLSYPVEKKHEKVDLNCILSLRKALKLTQYQVAKEINLAQSQYCLLEKGELKLKKAENYRQQALEKLKSMYQDTL